MRTSLILLVVSTIVAAKWWNGRPPGGLVNAPFRHVDSRTDTTQYPGQIQSTFSQKLDHFDPTDTGRWSQKMFYNPNHADRVLSNGKDIIFLMIGGEGKESAKWSGDDNVMIMQYAAHFGATVFDLEHRFFGDSRPINDMTTATLRLLTTEQALADLAYFINVMNQQHEFVNPKWVVFGGSYPGALCGMFRSKYPELTVGGVCSSAPLDLSLDFYQYADVMEYVYTQTPIENKKNMGCADLVRESFDLMHQLSLTAEGRDQLNEKLRLNPPFDANTTKADISNFFSNVFTAHQGMIQYTYDGQSTNSKNYLTAAQSCKIYNQDKDVLDNVWDHLVWYSQYEEGVDITKDGFDNSYGEALKDIAETDYDKLGEGGSSGRGWMWLCCNEMGWLQTTDGDSIFGSTLPMNFYYDMCMDLFGDFAMPPDLVRDNNKAAIQYYGGLDNFDATNLCLVNGKFDPWGSLGYYKEDKTKNIVAVVIEGAAHCSDMYAPYDGEPAGLPAARNQIIAFLEGILSKPAPPTTSAAPTTSVPPTTTMTSTKTSTTTSSPTTSGASVAMATVLPIALYFVL